MALLTEEQAQLTTYDGFKQRFEGYVSKGMTHNDAYDETERDLKQITGQSRYACPDDFLRGWKRSQRRERERRSARAVSARL
jgi:hypothetical protein